MNNRIWKCALAVGLAAGAAGCSDGDSCDEVGVICTVAGNGEYGTPAPEGTATQEPLYFPLDVTAGPDGKLYIVDFNNNCIRDLDPATGVMRLVIGSGLFDDCPGGECDARTLGLNHPSNITFDGGDALVSATFNSKVFRIELASGRVTQIYGDGSRDYVGDGGPVASAAFNVPTSVVVEPAGGLLVLDQQNQVIRRIDPDGVVDRVAGGCFTDSWEDGSLPSCTTADAPAVCEGTDKLTCSAEEYACIAPCLPDFGGDGGPATEARFGFDYASQAMPTRMTRTPSGDLLIADTNNHRIRRIDAEGVITTAAGTGAESDLDTPYDVAVDADGTMYIADSGSSCVRAQRPGGELETVAGQCGTRGFSGDDGPAVDALLDRVMGVEVVDDVLYVADTLNHVVRAVRLR